MAKGKSKKPKAKAKTIKKANPQVPWSAVLQSGLAPRCCHALWVKKGTGDCVSVQPLYGTGGRAHGLGEQSGAEGQTRRRG